MEMDCDYLLLKKIHLNLVPLPVRVKLHSVLPNEQLAHRRWQMAARCVSGELVLYLTGITQHSRFRCTVSVCTVHNEKDEYPSAIGKGFAAKINKPLAGNAIGLGSQTR